MSSPGAFDRLIGVYQGLPRAGRWLVWTVAVVVGYFGVVEPALDWRAEQKAVADRLHRAIEEENELATGGVTTLASGWYGPTAHPADAKVTRAAVDAAINEILAEHGVQARIAESVDRLRGDAGESLAPAGWRVDRVVLTLTFDASPEVASRVIADLERSEVLAGMSSVLLTKTGERTTGPGSVRATVTVEAWLAKRVGVSGVAAAGGTL